MYDDAVLCAEATVLREESRLLREWSAWLRAETRQLRADAAEAAFKCRALHRRRAEEAVPEELTDTVGEGAP
jgi:hypothetical protein